MADTFTTNLNLTKPEPGAAEDTWGISLNSDLDVLDAIFSSSGTQINLNPNQVNFADNKKAIFGTGSDLEIYHSGNDSFIRDAGTGDLYIRSSSALRLQSLSGENYAVFTENGAATFYYDNGTKLATTSTGIDVTGTVTSDGLSVASDTNVISTLGRAKIGAFVNDYAYFSHIDHATTSSYALNQNSAGATSINAASGSSIGLKINNSNALTVASNSNVGIGTTSPNQKLEIKTTSGTAGFRIHSDTTSAPRTEIEFMRGTTDTFGGDAYTDWKIGHTGSNQADFAIVSSDTTRGTNERVTIEYDTGNVGIGIDSPTTPLHVYHATTDTVANFQSGDNSVAVNFTALDNSMQIATSNTDGILKNNGAGSLRFFNNGSEAARIDGSQNLMVGKTTAGVSTTGVELRNYGQILATRSGNYPLLLNRTTSDGDIIQLRKDGTTVGSIGAESSKLNIGNGDTGIEFNAVQNSIIPHNQTSNANVDNSIDLGFPSLRFKDLYLSGGHMNGQANAFSFISGGNASNAGANILLYGQSHASLANTTIFRASGSETARIDASGNFMVGVTSTTLTGGSLTLPNSGIIAFHDAAGNARNALQFVSGQLKHGAAGAGLTSQTFHTSNVEAMRIDSSQRVGIGRTPTSNLLEVADTIKLTNLATGEGFIGYNTNGVKLGITATDSVGAGMKFEVGASERARIDASGNFGIGTSSPQNNSGRTTLTISNSTNGGILEIFGASDTRQLLIYNTTGESRFETLSGGSEDLVFRPNGSEQMRVTSTGLGIGTDSPSTALSIQSSGANGIDLEADSSATTNSNRLFFSTSAGTNSIMGVSGALTFRTGATAGSASGTERMRLDSSGNLLVGTTTVSLYNNSSEVGTRIGDGVLMVNRSANTPAYFNRLSTDGNIVDFRKDGTQVGSIGVAASDNFYIGASASGHAGLYFDNGNMVPMSSNLPADNVIDLGSPLARFDDIYATNGTIQTSDRNEKQDIAELSEAETRVAVAAKGLLKKFKFKSAVAEKGDEARIHFGIIAQDLQDAFTAEGLDASDYAMFCSNTWTDDDGVEQTRLGVRYSELLAFIIAAI